MAPVAKFQVGAVALTRVAYFDVPLDPAAVGLTAVEVASVEWAKPTWASAEGQVRVGQVVWVIESQGQVIVVDPCGASDPFLRTGPEAIGHQDAVLQAMRAAGFPADRVDTVVLSHLDGIGLTAVVAPDGSWSPAFPNARIVMTAVELAFLAGGPPAQGIEALHALIAQGAVDGVDDGHVLTNDVRLEISGGHSNGHAYVRVDSDGERATFVGHLALSPIHLATGDLDGLHFDGARAAPVLDALLSDAVSTDMLLIGPLWPYPGAVRLTEGRVVAAATPI